MNGVDFLSGAFGRGIDKITNIVGKWGSSQPVDDSKSGIKIGDKIYQVVVSLNGCYWYLDEEGKKHPVSGIPATTEWEWINIAEKVIKDFKTCYRTPGGKVEVWSWYLLNDQMDVLKETHRITDSTDMDNPVGKVLTKIPDEWVMIDCDLPDMTERDIAFVNRCYKTQDGKVEIEGLEAIDDKINIRESIYTVIQSTDDNFPAGHVFKLIPENWVRMVCDFPDLTERHIMSVDECYTTPGGKIHLGGYRSVDSIIGVRDEYLIVLETTDPDIQRGATFSKIQEGWQRIVCDFPDATTSDTEIVENCYKTEKGKVQIRTYITMDGYGNTRELRHMVLKTTDPDYNIGSNIDQIPVGWLSIECDFASATQRHIRQVKNCYASDAGSIYVEGEIVYDNDLDVDKMALTVMESTDPAIAVGTELAVIPSGYVRTVCRCNCCNH